MITSWSVAVPKFRQPTKGETPTKGGNAFSVKEMRFFYLGATL
jgi:hypothetical protein